MDSHYVTKCMWVRVVVSCGSELEMHLVHLPGWPRLKSMPRIGSAMRQLIASHSVQMFGWPLLEILSRSGVSQCSAICLGVLSRNSSGGFGCQAKHSARKHVA